MPYFDMAHRALADAAAFATGREAKYLVFLPADVLLAMCPPAAGTAEESAEQLGLNNQPGLPAADNVILPIHRNAPSKRT